MQGIPITWGYLLLPLGALLNWRALSLPQKSQRCLIALIPLQLLFLYSALVNGIEDLGFFFAFLYSFFLLPLCLLCFDFPLLQPNWIRKGVLILAVYGIFLFFFKLITGEFFEIPYLTVNAADVGHVGEKCIERGDYFKLISTYQNGNLFGICILMLLPLYSQHEKCFWKRSIVKLALLLTLSRTVWAGLIFYELVVERKFYKFFLIGAGLIGLSHWMGFSLDFFFDDSLGGRSSGFDVLREMTLFPNKPFGAVQEMVYVGIVENLGLLGLLAFLVVLVTPLFYVQQRAPFFGLILYLFLCLSDGALLLIPTIAIYWILTKKMMEPSQCPEIDKGSPQGLVKEPLAPI